MRILLVEDDEKIASFIIKGLKAEGFAVDHEANGEDGLHLALTEPYDAARRLAPGVNRALRCRNYRYYVAENGWAEID
jgi:DNA-binding response OmpR family regulator